MKQNTREIIFRVIKGGNLEKKQCCNNIGISMLYSLGLVFLFSLNQILATCSSSWRMGQMGALRWEASSQDFLTSPAARAILPLTSTHQCCKDPVLSSSPRWRLSSSDIPAPTSPSHPPQHFPALCAPQQLPEAPCPVGTSFSPSLLPNIKICVVYPKTLLRCSVAAGSPRPGRTAHCPAISSRCCSLCISRMTAPPWIH